VFAKHLQAKVWLVKRTFARGSNNVCVVACNNEINEIKGIWQSSIIQIQTIRSLSFHYEGKRGTRVSTSICTILDKCRIAFSVAQDVPSW
jgi:hypothetical protein